jgi:hypothetical protein
MKFITFIQTLWCKTSFSLQINVYVVGLFPTRCSVTQGCPMSKMLFAWILNPLICLCHGGGLVGQFDEHPGRHILSGNNHTGFEID